MKKITKKFAVLALSTALMATAGAAVGAYSYTYDAITASAAFIDGMTKVDTAAAPASAMPLEEGKVKNAAAWGYYDNNGDGKGDVWYFELNNPGSAPEMRFSTPGTNTEPTSASRVYKPITVNSISVDYKITKTAGTELAESSTTSYLLQILGAKEGTGTANQYYYHVPDIKDDGEWHTLTIDLNSAFTGGSNENLPMNISSFDDINDLVCCWNFKTSKDFVGEVMFKNFQVDEVKNEIDLSQGVRKGDWNNGTEFTGLYFTRIWINQTWTAGEVISRTDRPEYAAMLDAIKVNGKSVNEWTADWKAGKTPAITWEGMDDEGHNIGYKKGMLDRIWACTQGDVWMPIDVKLCNHGGAGCSIDIYIPKSMVPTVNSIEITSDFEYVEGSNAYTFGDGIYMYGTSFGYGGINVGEKKQYEIVETTILQGYHTNSNGGAFYLYPETHDYPASVGDYVLPAQVPTFKDMLKTINYYDYIEFDGVKLGTFLNGYQGEAFINVWGKKGTYSFRWPEGMTEEQRNAVKEVKILAGCQLPSYENPTGKLFQVKEDVTLVRMADGWFISTEDLLTKEDLTVSEAVVAGDAQELYKVTISSDKWDFANADDKYVLNRAQYNAVRSSILLNGVSILDIATKVDDSNYAYATFPWTHDDKATFQHPVLLMCEGNTLEIYVHQQYLEDTAANELKITVAKGMNNGINNTLTVKEDVTYNVWAKPINVAVIWGNRMMGEMYSVTGKYGEIMELSALETPKAAGKEFLGWSDVEGNVVTEIKLAEDTAIFATWKVNEYTVTIKQIGAANQTIVFGAEIPMGETNIQVPFDYVASAVAALLPANTETVEYAWATALPETFEYKNYTFEIIETPVISEEAAFKFSAYNATLAKTLYLNGAMSGYYMATTDNPAEAINVYAEKSGAGYKFYTLVNEEKSYITMTVSGTYVNMGYAAEGRVFYFDKVKNCWYTDINGTNYYPGTYTKTDGKTYDTISASKVSYITEDNLGVTQFPLTLTETFTLTAMNGNPRMGGTMETYTMVAGQAIALEALTANGKKFIGWVDGEGNAAPATMPAEDLVVYASWEVNAYTVTIYVNETTTITLKYGVEDVYAEDPANVIIGVNSIAWAIESELANLSTELIAYSLDLSEVDFNELKDYEFKATEEEAKFVMTVINGNPRLDPSAITTSELTFGAEISLDAPAAQAGKTFVGWFMMDPETGDMVAVPATMPATDIAIYAVWEMTVYTMTIVNGETTETINFAIEYDFENGVEISVNDLAFVLAGKLPAEDDNYTYAWDVAVPETFELKDYTFTVVATEKEKDTTSDTTSDSTSDSTDNNSKEEKKGCGSVIGSGVAISGIALAAAALVIKKRKED